jgi:hypothetical protein
VAVLLAIFWSAPVIWWWVGGPAWLIGACFVFASLLTRPLLGTWRKRGARDNWVFALTNSGLWINLRDCAYQDVEAAPSIVQLEFDEVAGARKVVRRYTVPNRSDGGNAIHYKDVYLELALANAETAARLRAAIAEEQQRHPPERKLLGGKVTMRTRRTETAIEMGADDCFCVKFSGGSYRLVPTLKKVLPILGRFVTLHSDWEPEKQAWQDLSADEFDALVSRLVAGGNRFSAIKLVEAKKKLSLTEARAVVLDLEQRLLERAATAGV